MNSLQRILHTMGIQTMPVTLNGVNVGFLARKLRPEQAGVRDGKRNEPDTQATGPSHYEQAVASRLRRELQGLNETVTGRMKTLESRWQYHAERFHRSRMQEIPQEGQMRLAEQREQFRMPLLEARRVERQAQRDLYAFMHENRLRRAARYPTSLLNLYLGLGAIVIVESLINAFAFREASNLGLLGGALSAMVIAGLNVFAGFVAGNALRGFNHVRWWRKLLAAGVTLVYGGFLATFLLLVGHYRTQLLVDVDTAAVAAVHQLQLNPWVIEDFNSLILMAFSLGFALLALLGGYHSSDHYPGYAVVDRHYKRALARLERLNAQYDNAVRNVHHWLFGEVVRRRKGADEARSAYRNTILDARELDNRYKHAVSALRLACQALIQTYREANQAVRNSPPPAYFTQPLEPFEPDDTLDVAGSLSAAEEVEAGFPQLVEQLDEDERAVQAQLSALHRDSMAQTAAFIDSIYLGRPSSDTSGTGRGETGKEARPEHSSKGTRETKPATKGTSRSSDREGRSGPVLLPRPAMDTGN